MKGVFNICAGPGAGASLTTGSNNILIGPDAGKGLTTESRQVVITDWQLAYRLFSLGEEQLDLWEEFKERSPMIRFIDLGGDDDPAFAFSDTITDRIVVIDNEQVVGIITKIDLIEYLASQTK